VFGQVTECEEIRIVGDALAMEGGSASECQLKRDREGGDAETVMLMKRDLGMNVTLKEPHLLTLILRT
jgi:hypothetical protein